MPEPGNWTLLPNRAKTIEEAERRVRDLLGPTVARRVAPAAAYPVWEIDGVAVASVQVKDEDGMVIGLRLAPPKPPGGAVSHSIYEFGDCPHCKAEVAEVFKRHRAGGGKP